VVCDPAKNLNYVQSSKRTLKTELFISGFHESNPYFVYTRASVIRLSMLEFIASNHDTGINKFWLIIIIIIIIYVLPICSNVGQFIFIKWLIHAMLRKNE